MRILLAGVTLAVAIFLGGTASYAEGEDSWSAPYTPTRLVWLATFINDTLHMHCTPNPAGWCIGKIFMALPPNTIVVGVTTKGAVPLDVSEKVEADAKKQIERSADLFDFGVPNIIVRRQSGDID